MPRHIRIRRDVAADWTSINPVLLEAELGLESDTGKIKIGNGTSTWTALSYANFGISGAGTVNSGTQYRMAYYASTGDAVSETSPITSSRALVSDTNGIPTHSTVTSTELGYINGVSSPVQSQLNNKQSLNSNLSAIGGLSPANDDVIQRKAGVWTNRTITQLKSDLGVTGTNTGDQSSIVGITGTKAQFDTAVTDGNILYVGDITQYTDEQAQDAVGAMVDSTIVYVDATPALGRAAISGDITIASGSNTSAITAGVIVDADVNASAAISISKIADGTTFLKSTDDTDDISVGTTNKFATAAEKTKLSNISITQAVDLDVLESDTATNNAKVSNATHTGDVTGAISLTIDPTAITGKSAVTPIGSDYILISDTSDSGNLKKALISDLPGGGGSGGISNVVEDATPQLGGNLDLNGFTVGDATAIDLTKLNSLTPTATELNYVDGVTSPIQTQIDGKAASSHTHTASQITDFNTTADGRISAAVGVSVQAYDSDLATIAGLTPTTNNFIVGVSSAWASRTPTQVKTTLAIANTDVSGLGTLSTQNGIFSGSHSGTSSGTNTGDQTSVTGNAGTATAWATGRTIGITGDVTYTSPSLDGTGNVTASATVTKINGTSLAGLATGLLKNTTSTGVPSIATVRTDYAEPTAALATGILKNTTTTGAHTIAVAADFPTLNQNTSGNSATATALQTGRTINGTTFDGTGNITVTAAAGTLTGTTLNSTVTTSSLTSFGTSIALGTPASGVATNLTGTAAGLTAGNVTTNANLTGDVTSVGNASTLATVNSNTGSFGSSTAIPSFTVNGKGLITAASANVVVAPASTLSGTTLNSTVVTSSLTSVGTIATGVWNGTTIAVANGGTGTATPGLIAGTNITSITGIWPNQTINASGGGGGTSSIASSTAAGIPYVYLTDGSSVSIAASGGLTSTNSASTITIGVNNAGIDLTTKVTGTLPVGNGGTGVTSSTGSGNNVLSTSPVLVTPALGTPSTLVLTNATGLPIAAHSATGTPSATTYLRGDNTWATPAGGSGITVGTTTITSGTSGRVHYNASGVVGEAAGVNIQAEGNFNLTANACDASVTNPASGTANAIIRTVGDRSFLAVRGSTDVAESFAQPHLGFKRWGLAGAQNGSTTITFSGGLLGTTLSGAGTATSNSLFNSPGNILDETSYIKYTTSTAANNAGYIASSAIVHRGTAAAGGNFFSAYKVCFPTYNSGQRIFVGMGTINSTISSTTDPSAGVDMIGIGKDAADANLQIMANDASGVATKTDLGVAVDNTAIYYVTISWKSASTTAAVELWKVTQSGGLVKITTSLNSTISSNLPTAGTVLKAIMGINNAATAAALVFGFEQVYVEKDF